MFCFSRLSSDRPSGVPAGVKQHKGQKHWLPVYMLSVIYATGGYAANQPSIPTAVSFDWTRGGGGWASPSMDLWVTLSSPPALKQAVTSILHASASHHKLVAAVQNQLLRPRAEVRLPPVSSCGITWRTAAQPEPVARFASILGPLCLCHRGPQTTGGQQGP